MNSRNVGVPSALAWTGEKISAAAITATYPSRTRRLRCGGCGVQVTAVAGYVREGNTVIDPLFRLKPGLRHHEGCPYDYPDVIRRTLRTHPAIQRSRDGTYNITVPTMPLTGDPDTGALLRALHAVEAIVHRFSGLPSVLDNFTVTCAETAISWRDFYFDAYRDIKRLHAHLKVEPSTPTLVVGVIEDLQPATTGSTFAARIRTRTPTAAYQGPVRSTAGIPILPVIRARKCEELPGPGVEVMAYGTWRLFGDHEQPTLWLGKTGVIHRLP